MSRPLSKQREFALGDVLSVTTQCMVSLRQREGVRDVLRHMTGHDVCDVDLPRAVEVCARALCHEHPWLAGVRLPEWLLDKQSWAWVWAWLDTQQQRHGDVVRVSALPEGTWHCSHGPDIDDEDGQIMPLLGEAVVVHFDDLPEDIRQFLLGDADPEQDEN